VNDKIQKVWRLLSEPGRFDRAHALFEIRLNQFFLDRKRPREGILAFQQFIDGAGGEHPALRELLQPGGEAEGAVQWVRSRFAELSTRPLPFPMLYNADRTLALLSYGLARYLRPRFAVETGVGYGITSALVLLALERNGSGRLASIDLPSLADPSGAYVGLAVPEEVKGRWSLLSGSSRRCLPAIVANGAQIDMFISDSANVYTLQRFEFETLFPVLAAGGAILFNNVGAKFFDFLYRGPAQVHAIWQIEKPGCATALVFKKNSTAKDAKTVESGE
jgi:hypothetical protein